MTPSPQTFSTAAELLAHTKAVRARLKSLKAWEPAPIPVVEKVKEVAPPIPYPPLNFPIKRTTLIIRMICAHYRLTEHDIRSPSHYSGYVRPRHIAMYLCVKHAGLSFPRTGKLFGGRDHATVHRAVAKIEASMARNPLMAEEIAAFVAQLGSKGE
jgi:hypothetical protein